MALTDSVCVIYTLMYLFLWPTTEGGADGAGGPSGRCYAVYFGDGQHLPAGPQGLFPAVLPESQSKSSLHGII